MWSTFGVKMVPPFFAAIHALRCVERAFEGDAVDRKSADADRDRS